MLKISWKDKVPNTEVLKRVGEKEQQFYRKIVQQKLAYAGHVLRGSMKFSGKVHSDHGTT